MKIECIKEKLQDAVSKVEKITSKNASLPILKCILIEANKECLIIKSTNLDIGVEIKIPAKIEEEGVIVVSGSILNSFLNNLTTEKTIKLDAKEGNLIVSTPKTNTIIKTFSNEEYPIIPKVESDNIFKIESNIFIDGIKSVWYSSATSSIKPELSSVYINYNNSDLYFVATDGFRLAEKTVKLKKVVDLKNILIPIKNAIELVRILDGIEGEIDIVIEQNQIAVSFENIYIVSRIVEGNFPDYKTIIPKDFVSEIIILKQDIINTFKISSVFTDSFNHTKFLIHPEEKTLEIITKNNNVGENSVTIPCTISGQELDINFNYKYILDSLNSVNSDNIKLSFSGSNKPMVLKPVGDDNFLYLLMPMNK